MPANSLSKAIYSRGTPIWQLQRQRGIVVLSIIITLLTILVYLCMVTAQHIQLFTRVETVISTNTLARLEAKAVIRDIIDRLHLTTVAELAPSYTGVETEIHSLELVGDQQQSLQQLNVSVHSSINNIRYTARFLRYPSLLRLPKPQHLSSPDENISQWLFNREKVEFTPTYFPAFQYVENCDQFSQTGAFWVKGHCEIDKHNTALNNTTTPVLMIVEDGDIVLKQGAQFKGLIVHLSDDARTYQFRIKTGAAFYGAFVSNTTVDKLIAGTITYSSDTLGSLQHDPALYKIIPIPGSWYAD
ncbi:hypothetical protein D210916BOD24_08990 [Alteromonas sp. D210916BOD_24]|uniref:hypothetical protein n=1 Tax=Alteromonas sp. D210916BOD_24 TaxID=3157618 RepID=UPI00399C4EE5